MYSKVVIKAVDDSVIKSIYGNNVVNTAVTDGTNAAAEHILSGKKAFVNGSPVTGSIPTKSNNDLTVNGGTIENTCETATDVTNAVDNHSSLSHEYGNNCILTVNGGTLTGAYYYAIRQYTHYLEGVQNRVVINDGDINGGVYMQHGDS